MCSIPVTVMAYSKVFMSASSLIFTNCSFWHRVTSISFRFFALSCLRECCDRGSKGDVAKDILLRGLQTWLFAGKIQLPHNEMRGGIGAEPRKFSFIRNCISPRCIYSIFGIFF